MDTRVRSAPSLDEDSRSRNPVAVRNVISVMRRIRCALVLAVGLAACSGGSHHAVKPPATTVTTGRRPTSVTTASAPMQHFSAGVHLGLSFDHPRAWRESRYEETSSFYLLIVYLSNERLHPPCTTTPTNGGVLTRCGDPIARLAPGGVLVSWGNVGFPHTGPEIPHPNSRINGLPASVKVERPGNCGRIGGDETITADVARPLGNHYEMVACLRGPNVSGNAALVRRMLALTKVTG